MALQVLKFENTYAGKAFHLIRKKSWGPASDTKLITLQIQLWCEDKAFDRTPSKFHGIEVLPYDKETHKKKLCNECVVAVKKVVHKPLKKG